MRGLVHLYTVAIGLYPERFRRRYAAEMILDFEDALQEARLGGWHSVVALGTRTGADWLISLFREWLRGRRPAILLATAAATLILWGLALRPWAWRWDMEPHRTPRVALTSPERSIRP